MYNVTFTRLRLTTITVAMQLRYIFWVCVYRLRYPACNAHAPYCHLWPARLYNIFPQCLINGKIFGKIKKVTKNKMCVLIFSTTLSETFFVLRRNERDMIENICWFEIQSTDFFFFADFNENWIFSTDFRKVFKRQISWRSVQWEQSCSKWSDRQTLSNFANAPINKKGIADLL